MHTTNNNSERREKLSLLWRFLRGAKRYFLITVLAAGVTALADMLQPQIIRAAVDCAIGGKEADFPPLIMDLVDKVGGFSYLGQNLWIMAAAILIVALFQVVSQYTFRVYNTAASETLLKTMPDHLSSPLSPFLFPPPSSLPFPSSLPSFLFLPPFPSFPPLSLLFFLLSSPLLPYAWAKRK